MTIAAAYLVSEGVVIGADSTTTATINGDAVQLLNHAQKVFEVGAPGASRFAFATWNAATVGAVSHRTMVARLAARVSAGSTHHDVRWALIDLVDEERKRQGADALGRFGVFLGGIEPRTHLPACASLTFDRGVVVESQDLQIGDAVFQGAPEFFGRTFNGFDPQLPELLYQELERELGGTVPNFDKKYVAAFRRVVPSLVAAGHSDLPMREAIDFVHTYLHVTVKAFKFRYGAPICGGPLEIGFLTSDRPFRWVLHKPFDTAISEPMAER